MRFHSFLWARADEKSWSLHKQRRLRDKALVVAEPNRRHRASRRSLPSSAPPAAPFDHLALFCLFTISFCKGTPAKHIRRPARTYFDSLASMSLHLSPRTPEPLIPSSPCASGQLQRSWLQRCASRLSTHGKSNLPYRQEWPKGCGPTLSVRKTS